MKKLLSLLLAVSLPAHADIYLGGWSHHLNGGDYNETHNLIAVECDQFIGGYFLNSYSQDTFFFGYKANVVDNSYFNAGLMFGGMHGYGDRFPNVFGVAPMVSPYVSIGNWYVKPTVMMLGSAVALTFRIDL